MPPLDALRGVVDKLRAFAPLVRHRGQEYARSGRVGRLIFEDDAVRAKVHGTKIYDASWAWQLVGTTTPACSCPGRSVLQAHLRARVLPLGGGACGGGLRRRPARALSPRGPHANARWRGGADRGQCGEYRPGRAPARDAAARAVLGARTPPLRARRVAARARARAAARRQSGPRAQRLLAALPGDPRRARYRSHVLAPRAGDPDARRRLAAARARALPRSTGSRRPPRRPCAREARSRSSARGHGGRARSRRGASVSSSGSPNGPGALPRSGSKRGSRARRSSTSRAR